MIRKCTKCDSKELYLIRQYPHIALRCKRCNSWLGWVRGEHLSYYRHVLGVQIVDQE